MKKHFFTIFLFLALNFLTTSAKAVGTWSYKNNEDKMTSTVTKFATLMSDNTLSLPFPYDDSGNYGVLTIRQSSGKSVDVLVSIRRGQILCAGYGDGCTVTVRFDNDKPVRFGAIGPSDHSSTVFFIRNTGRLLAGAKKAKRILIQFTMYNAGEQTLEFNPAQILEWGTARAKKTVQDVEKKIVKEDEKPLTLGHSCNTLGFRYGYTAASAMLGEKPKAGWDFVMPERCKNDMGTELGIKAGANATSK